MGNNLLFLSNPIIGIRKGGNCLRAESSRRRMFGEPCGEKEVITESVMRREHNISFATKMQAHVRSLLSSLFAYLHTARREGGESLV